MARSVPLLALVSVAVLACSSSSAHGAPNAPDAPAPAAASAPSPAAAALPALWGGHAWIEPVGDDARLLAQVTVPLGATTARPIMIALHGANDRAEWACAEWRGVVKAVPFVVCPRGDKTGRYWDAPKSTLADLQLAIAEVRNRFDGYVEPHDPEVLAGFSLGAVHALALILQTDLRAASLALAEGGYDTLAQAGVPKQLAARGVTRVLLACTTTGHCPGAYRAAQQSLARAGIDAHFIQAARGEHGMYAEVVDALAAEAPWLVAGRHAFD
jgi:predicted esterase